MRRFPSYLDKEEGKDPLLHGYTRFLSPQLGKDHVFSVAANRVRALQFYKSMKIISNFLLGSYDLEFDSR